MFFFLVNIQEDNPSNPLKVKQIESFSNFITNSEYFYFKYFFFLFHWDLLFLYLYKST